MSFCESQPALSDRYVIEKPTEEFLCGWLVGGGKAWHMSLSSLRLSERRKGGVGVERVEGRSWCRKGTYESYHKKQQN